jgi:tRNA A37 threonylcarbamoyladenosine biosynthesis protein TsaE
MVEADGVLLVEWGDVVSSTFGDHLLVRLEPGDGDDERRISIGAVGRSWAARWERIGASVARYAC